MKDYTAATYGDRIALRPDGDGSWRRWRLALGAGGARHRSSEAMVARLRAKPGGDAIPVTIGDFADCRVDGTFELVFVVFNTFFMLTTQEQQVLFRPPSTSAAAFSDRGVRARPDAFRERPERRHLAPGVRHGAARPGPPRRRRPARDLPARRDRRNRNPALPDGAALRLALGAGPDGAPGRPPPAQASERLGRLPVHLVQHQSRLATGTTPPH